MTNRTIKFRAQHRVTKEWKTFVIPIDLFKSRDDEIGDYINFVQYTGLKDKNGKDVYEGDVVVCQSDQYQIKWVRYGFTLSLITSGKIASFWELNDLPEEMTKDIEIIGNIYENPELL